MVSKRNSWITLCPLGAKGIVVPCAVCPSVPPSLPLYRPREHEPYWLWGIYVNFLGFCGTLKIYYTLIGVCPCYALQPTIFHRFCSSVWYKTKFGSQNFWLTTLVTFGHRLQKLVTNISSDLHDLVNTGLAVGSLVKWLPIEVANPSEIDKFEWFIAPRLQTAPSDCNHLKHTMPCEILHPMVWGTSVNSLVLILKTIDFSCLASYFSGKATKVGSPPNFQSSYLSSGESLNHNTLSHYY